MRSGRLVITTMPIFTFSVGASPQRSGSEGNVRINRATLFVLPSGVGSIAPAERAQVVNQHLREILKSSPRTSVSGRLRRLFCGLPAQCVH
jgi:hypothetical protein